MVTIFIPETNSRIEYSFNLILHDILKLDFKFENSLEAFKNVSGAKINYHTELVEGAMNFVPSGLLSESDINDLDIQHVEYNGIQCPFKVEEGGLLPFDLFSAAFYLVTRYEEYGGDKVDRLGRFRADKSLAFKNRFLEKPVVNVWAMELAKLLASNFPDLKIPEREFHFISTIDIDNAFAYLEKGLLRTLGGFARSILYLDFYRFFERISVLIRAKKDPYDTFDYIVETTNKYKVEFKSFFLLGDYGPQDKNVPHTSKLLQDGLRKLQDMGEVGIHPSVGSSKSGVGLENEKSRLESILGNPSEISRQHYLMMSFPETYRRLIEVGIKADYSMGYSTHVGYRASICTPFIFFDLSSNNVSELRVHPFAVMDVTLKNGLNQVPVQAIKTIANLVKEVKSVRGTFIGVWHNESLSENLEWSGWRDVYESMLEPTSI
ncbi:MAG: hypothetical protein COB05_09275 [Marinobacter sp.]|nr:MAG: hypothetical protein COB05_09275 [Marinobacter sp.]